MPNFSTEFWVASGLAIFLFVLATAVALGMDTKTKSEYVFVICCFCCAWLAIVATCVLWYFHATDPPFYRAIISGIFVAFATIGVLLAIGWATDRHERTVFVEKGPQTSSEAPAKAEAKPPDKPAKPHPHVSKPIATSGPMASLEMQLTPVMNLDTVQLYVDLTFINVGQLTARKVVRLHRMAIGKVILPENEEKVKKDVDVLWNEFAAANAKEPLGTNDIGIQQQGSWRYEYSDFGFKRPLTIDTLKDINEGTSTLFVFVALKYSDDLHPLLESTACISYSKGITATCHGHNTMPL